MAGRSWSGDQETHCSAMRVLRSRQQPIMARSRLQTSWRSRQHRHRSWRARVPPLDAFYVLFGVALVFCRESRGFRHSAERERCGADLLATLGARERVDPRRVRFRVKETGVTHGALEQPGRSQFSSRTREIHVMISNRWLSSSIPTIRTSRAAIAQLAEATCPPKDGATCGGSPSPEDGHGEECVHRKVPAHQDGIICRLGDGATRHTS